MKRDDPYAKLGLSYGDGASTSEIKAAFRRKAAELHPDVNTTDRPDVALRKFRELHRAYESLIKVHSNLNGLSEEKDEEWRVSVWRNGDRIAVDRTDVAGAMRKRPVPPSSVAKRHGAMQLGHPSGRGLVTKRGEYLGDGDSGQGGASQWAGPSSSVGRGMSKWVTPREFKPWNGGRRQRTTKPMTTTSTNVSEED